MEVKIYFNDNSIIYSDELETLDEWGVVLQKMDWIKLNENILVRVSDIVSIQKPQNY